MREICFTELCDTRYQKNLNNNRTLLLSKYGHIVKVYYDCEIVLTQWSL